MRFLTWCAGVTVCLCGLELSLEARDGWKWVWITLMIFYGVAGVVGTGLMLTKWAAGKLGAGIGRTGGRESASGPILAPRTKEVEK